MFENLSKKERTKEYGTVLEYSQDHYVRLNLKIQTEMYGYRQCSILVAKESEEFLKWFFQMYLEDKSS